MHSKISSFLFNIQENLFPRLESCYGKLGSKQEQLIQILELVRIEERVGELFSPSHRGRPERSRAAFARSFIAKSFYNITTVVSLVDRLKNDSILRMICGWQSAHTIPDISTFSRAFAAFSDVSLAEYTHEKLIGMVYKDNVVGHVSRDSTAILAREKSVAKPTQVAKKPKKRGRPKKGTAPIKKEPSRIEKQIGQSLCDMKKDISVECNIGTKKNSKGFKEIWKGYKLHIDVADGDVPLSVILSSASVHDSQLAIPLATTTAMRVDSLYDLMDAAYDDPNIKKHSKSLGHVPIIDVNPRRNAELKKEKEREAKARKNIDMAFPESIRYNQRSSAERVNARLKDEFAARTIYYRGAAKVLSQLTFSIVVIAADQILRMTT